MNPQVLIFFFTDVPILSVATKGDKLQEASFLNLNLQQYDLNLAREKYFKNLSSRCRKSPNQNSVFLLQCYQCEMDHVSDQPAFEIKSCVKRDSNFLKIWREIVLLAGRMEMPAELRNREGERRRAVSESVHNKHPAPDNSCIPAFRLRINSYS